MNYKDIKDQLAARVEEKDKKKKAEDKKKFLKDRIAFRVIDDDGRAYVDDHGDLDKTSEFRITRKNLTLGAVYNAIKASPNPDIEVDYFCDNEGKVLWMDDLKMQAKPDPMYYIIVPIKQHYPADVYENPQYEGQSTLTLSGVPLYCRDEVTPVDVSVLREWFLFALVEEDPFFDPYNDKIAEAKALVGIIEKKIKEVGKMQFFEFDGTPMKPEQAAQEKELLFNAYEEKKKKANQLLEKREKDLKRQVEWRRRIGTDFTLIKVDEDTTSCSYRVRFHGQEDAHFVEDLMLAKDDWGGIKVAAGDPNGDPPLPPWVGRGKIPDGSGGGREPIYTVSEVKMAGVRITRVPHGVGTWRKLDRQSANISAERFGMYYGNWELGKKSGHGLEFDDAGVYCGRFVDGFRDGHGRLDMADGTTVVGTFGKTLQVKQYQENNPYLEGTPHGEVEILFPDGAIYKGTMKNGRIGGGHGYYQSAFNEEMEGNFENGVLNGKEGYTKNIAGEIHKGGFKYGVLEGKGTYSNDRGDTYDGYWNHSLRHGRGYALYRNRGMYSGYFVNGYMFGKGELRFERKHKKREKKQTDEDEQQPAESPIRTATTTATTATTTGGTETPVNSSRPNSSARTRERSDTTTTTTAAAAAATTTTPLARSPARSSPASESGTKSSPGKNINVSSPSRSSGRRPDTAQQQQQQQQQQSIYIPPDEDINSTPKKSVHQLAIDSHPDPTGTGKSAHERYAEDDNFSRAFMGYFLGDAVDGGGIITTEGVEVPRILSRLNRLALAPITRVRLQIEKTNKRINRKQQKFSELQVQMREIIVRKKSRIFRQQRHITKKTMYASDVRDEGTEDAELQARQKTRKFRLQETDLNRYKPTKALVPRLQLISTDAADHLKKKFDVIQPDIEDGNVSRVKKTLPRFVVSDFEEVIERQRFLKYDRIWQRAEEAFLQKRRAMAHGGAAVDEEEEHG